MSAQPYRALRTRWGWARREDRAVFRVTGERHVAMIDGLITNDLEGTPVGHALWALLLTPKGRILADLRILRRAEELWVDVPAVTVETLEATFKKFLPPRLATARHWPEALVLGLHGPDAPAAAEQIAGAAPERPLTFAETGQGADLLAVVRDDGLRIPGFEILGSAPAAASLEQGLAAFAERTGGSRADEATLEVVRVEAGVPRYGVDVNGENIVQETGWEERAVSYEKGCYVGQEVVVRVHHRGHPNRQLRGLRFEGESPPPGTPLFAEGKAVGAVTTAVRSPRLGAIGLGYVRREVAPGYLVALGSANSQAQAEVVGLPFPL